MQTEKTWILALLLTSLWLWICYLIMWKISYPLCDERRYLPSSWMQLLWGLNERFQCLWHTGINFSPLWNCQTCLLIVPRGHSLVAWFSTFMGCSQGVFPCSSTPPGAIPFSVPSWIVSVVWRLACLHIACEALFSIPGLRPILWRVMRDLGIEGITGKTLMVSDGVPEGQHCLGDTWPSGSRAVEAGSRQLWGSGVIQTQGSRSPGLNRERNHTGSFWLESWSLHVSFFPHG